MTAFWVAIFFFFNVTRSKLEKLERAIDIFKTEKAITLKLAEKFIFKRHFTRRRLKLKSPCGFGDRIFVTSLENQE